MLARANCLIITTLWTVFKFVMVPLGLQLAAVFPRQEFAVVFALIWVLHYGGWERRNRRIAVWRSADPRLGVGDINRKSLAGTGLGTRWLGLSLIPAASN